MIEISNLWDFNNPTLSEQRFRQALEQATGDDALLLQTQIARTYGLRKDFAQAQEILSALADSIATASPEVQVRYFLELGRTFASATHPPEAQTLENKAQATKHNLHAFEIAKAAHLDYLAVDALHMMAFVETEPSAQLDWDLKALAYMEASPQDEAKKSEASLRNNVGYAQHLLGRYDDAIQQFLLSLAAHQRAGNVQNVRIAYWMIAWTLRVQGKLQEALEIQLRLEQEWAADGEPDPYVFEELEQLYRAVGDTEEADRSAEKLRQAKLPQA
ncbi:tetratricopeptide repeat protein [Armatimonas sp.]|uniref:tetratricopeptide repeat protein n=1 Tax=Armatimonas sp. TaxID=1872638 RepID=UPI00286B20DC|nr:tetratricopeptide repeat protein [Armatimonas sp.]